MSDQKKNMAAKEFIHVARPFVGEEEVQAVARVLLSGRYVSGDEVSAFEQAFAGYIGTRFAVAVNSGTSALHVALEAMGVGPGDEVIVPPLTFFATVSAVLYLGAVPVFADIDPDNLCLSADSAAEKITVRTKAILPVHLFGVPADMDQLKTLAYEHQIDILEDCAQSHGSEYKGRKTGSLGRAGAFSFFATKHMTTGEGGMITTDDPDIDQAARIIRNHGMTGRDGHVRLGFNSRMTEMAAAMGRVQLRKLDDLNARRIANSEYILSHLRQVPGLRVPVTESSDFRHTYFWCPVVMEDKKKTTALKEHLTGHGIGFRHRYQAPLYRQPVLRKLGYDHSHTFLPVAEQTAGRVIGLPNHAGLTREQMDYIIEKVRDFFKS
jgi:dTDP-4-amino-4,6-dideoxygalactose transaminase